MNPFVTVVRAVAAEFIKRMLRPLIVAGSIVAVICLAAGGWLTTQNGWWWILEAVFIIATILLVVLVVVARIAIHFAEPSQDNVQRQAVKEYVDKLQRVSENLQTPQFVILFRVVRDIVQPRQGHDSFIATVSRDSKTLKPDFMALRQRFVRSDS